LRVAARARCESAAGAEKDAARFPLRTETEVKMSLAATPRSVARGRGTRRRRESVGTDSRVLCLGEAVNMPAEASGA